MRAAHRQIETALAQDLLARVHSALPDFFERLIVNLLLSMGYGGTSASTSRVNNRSSTAAPGLITRSLAGILISLYDDADFNCLAWKYRHSIG